MRRSDGVERVKLYNFFLREFFSLAVLSERLKQATNNFQKQLVFLPGCKRELYFHSISIIQKMKMPL